MVSNNDQGLLVDQEWHIAKQVMVPGIQLVFQSANCRNMEKTAEYLILSCHQSHHICFHGYFTGDCWLHGCGTGSLLSSDPEENLWKQVKQLAQTFLQAGCHSVTQSTVSKHRRKHLILSCPKWKADITLDLLQDCVHLTGVPSLQCNYIRSNFCLLC